MEFLIDDKYGYDDSDSHNIDEPGWLGIQEWDQLPLIFDGNRSDMEVFYGDKDKTD